MTSSTTAGRKETERTKLIQEKCQTLLTQMLRDEDNKYCVDCDAKGPRWASWNLGVFLCIRCAGIHRNLGVHISRVKSVNLDTWTPEQVISLQQMGNSRARAVYEAQLPDGFRRPQTDSALESFIRAKYEHKKYLAREWVPPSPPKVDWAKEIDEELERQKRKKKAAQAGAAIGLGVISGNTGSAASDKKSTSNAKSVPLPAPLPKPKSNSTAGSSPKTQRISSSSVASDANQTNDLLGLASPTKAPQASSGNANNSSEFPQNDNFSSFLSAPTANIVSSQQQQQQNPNQMDTVNGVSNATEESALAKEEEDFFNHGYVSSNGTGKTASGKLTKDSILALYGSAPKQPTNPHMGFGQTNPTAGMYGVPGTFGNMQSGGAAGGFINAANTGLTQQHQQFMTPPNSTSLYNTPVMTAPAAFSAPGMPSGMQMGSLNFATQFPVQGMSTNFGGMSAAAPSMMNMNGSSGSGSGTLVCSANPLMSSMATNMNLMQTNQSLLSGLQMQTMPQAQQTMPLANTTGGMNTFPTSMSTLPTPGMGMQAMGMGLSATTFQTTPNANTTTNTNLNQQFGNLNIGNVWQ